LRTAYSPRVNPPRRSVVVFHKPGRSVMTAAETLLVSSTLLVVISIMGLLLTVTNAVVDWLDG
jgi:hypothetical protein